MSSVQKSTGTTTIQGAMIAANASPPVVADTAPSMPDPDLAAMTAGGDVGAAIAAMVMMTAKEQAKSARAARDAAYDAMEAAQRDQLEQMKEQAEAKFMGSMTSGLMTIGGAACGVAGGLQEGDTAGSVWCKGLDKGAEGGAKVDEAIYNAQASRAEERAKDADMRAQTDKRVAEGHYDDKKDADELVRKAMEFYKEYETTKNDTQRAALLRA